MAVTAKTFYKNDSTPNASLTTAYTVPASTVSIVTFISLANKTASSVNATVVLGGVTFVPTTPIPANSVVTFDEIRIPLVATETIQVQAGTASALATIITGSEVV